jgi:non-ribosomal peptide synthetase-like protein
LDHGGIGYSCFAAYGIFVAVPLFRCLLAIVVKWIVIGRFKEGDFPLWGTMYLRWWTVDQFQRLAASESLSDTPLMAGYYRLLGAKIGRNVHLSGINCWAADLLEIGDGTTISSDVCMQTGFVDDYTLKFRRVCIQRDVYIGGRCVIGGQTIMEDHSELDDMSFLPSGTCVPSEEVWHGSPATYSHRASLIDAAKDPSSNFDNASTPISVSIIFGAILLLFLPFLYFVPMVPGLILFEYVKVPSISDWVQIIVFSPVVGILYTCFVVLEIILVHLLLVSNITVGVYSTKSWTYIRKWIFDLLSLSCSARDSHVLCNALHHTVSSSIGYENWSSL